MGTFIFTFMKKILTLTFFASWLLAVHFGPTPANLELCQFGLWHWHALQPQAVVALNG
jgi:hypothetical protein